MSPSTAAKAYAKISIESGISSADPHMLILMLYQGALLAIANARSGIMRKDIPGKGEAISKAIAIIDEGLKASLDINSGGSLAQNLSSLYEYMCTRLIVANMNNDVNALDEVARLLADLKDAWESIRPEVMQAASQQNPVSNAVPAAPQPKPVSNTQLVYGRV